MLSAVLGIVYLAIASRLIRQGWLTKTAADTGAVTLIQRFGSALNLNVHLHMLFLDGVYVLGPDVELCFRRVQPPSATERQAVLERIAQRGVNLTRFHGAISIDVGAEQQLRAQVTLAKRGKRPLQIPETAAERHQAMSWAQRLKRVFQIDIERCEHCSTAVGE